MGKGKNKGNFKYGPAGRQPQQPIKQPQPQISPEDKMTLDEAKAIIQLRDETLAKAQTKADTIIAEANQKKADVDAERMQLDADIAEYSERLETLRKDHESQAILDKAEELIAEAKQKAEDILQQEQRKADSALLLAQKQATQIAEKAQKDADATAQEAQKKKEQIILEAHKQAKSESDSIVNSAKGQASEIIAAAHEQEQITITGKEMAAQTRADDIVSQAVGYAKRTRNDADNYQVAVRDRADKYESETREKAEAQAATIITRAEERISKRIQALDERETAIHSEEAVLPAKAEEFSQRILTARTAELDRVQEEQANREAELIRRKAQLDYETKLLSEERNQFSNRVNESVEQKYSQLLVDFDTQKDATNQGLAKIRELQQELKELKTKFWQLRQDKPDAVAGQATQEELAERKKEVRRLLSELKKYNDNGITESRIQEFLGFEAENRQLREQVSQLQQDTNDAKIAANSQAATADQLKRAIADKKELEKQVKALREELDAKRISREEMISPIQQYPATASLQEMEVDPDVYRDETKWLEHIAEQTAASGISLSMRQFMAYHTSLKISEWSPMVVLAGVSGTGKSELPRQYATHGGMRFVSVPVKPDWDSPSSLFGYYNTIENKFEATELIRFLYQMQSKTGIGSDGSAAPWSNDMLLVLLDEMNLAHPEQYFADMLSKFEEARGSVTDPVYDITLGAGERVEPLRIGRNVLWTGTMNEDETTKGLSDKVIDRSMLITFPRPTELIGRSKAGIVSSSFRTSKSRWELWKNSALHDDESILPEELDRLRKIIEQINEAMSPMGRNLGHRVWQSMQHYILNYPTVIANRSKEDELRHEIMVAFCDAVAFKVMPKLRGLEVEGRNRDSFDKIRSHIAANVPDLIPDFDNARTLSSEVFQWSSAEFMR